MMSMMAVMAEAPLAGDGAGFLPKGCEKAMTWRERQAYIRPDLQGPEPMKSFVINLDRAPERLAHLDVTFGRHGLSFTRMAAVDAKLLTPREIAERCTPDAKLGVSELACFLSHRKCWQAIADLAIPHAVIFEDDVLLGKDAAEILNRSDWIPPHAALIKLETNARPTIAEKAIEGTWQAEASDACAGRTSMPALMSSAGMAPGAAGGQRAGGPARRPLFV